MNSVVIVGAGLGGVRTATALRAGGFTGAITLIGDESELPYDRPPLSKGYLAGRDDRTRIALRSAESYVADGLTLRLGSPVRGAVLGPSSVSLTLTDATVDADALVIATGSRTRPAPFPVSHASVHEVRRVGDADRLRPHLVDGARVVVIGAGFIGAEVACTAMTLGCQVTVLEALAVPLSRQLGEEMGRACASLHGRHGVSLLTDVTIESVTPEGVSFRVADAATVETLPADVVVIGVGVRPNTEWLDGSGVLVGDGVCTDESLRARTVDGDVLPNVVAVGDVARWTNPLFGEEMRIEHWTNAAESAEHAAATLLGNPEPYAPVPYFWSDQYGRKIQFFGRATGHDEVRVVHGSTDDDAWLALYRRGDRLVGVLGLHKMRAAVQLRAALAARATWDEALERADALR